MEREEDLYHWMINEESISMQNDMTAHLDCIRRTGLVLCDLCRF